MAGEGRLAGPDPPGAAQGPPEAPSDAMISTPTSPWRRERSDFCPKLGLYLPEDGIDGI